MDILREAKLMGVEPDAKDALGKTAKQSGTDDVRIAFTTLMDSISATPQPEIDDDSLLKSSMMLFSSANLHDRRQKGKDVILKGWRYSFFN